MNNIIKYGLIGCFFYCQGFAQDKTLTKPAQINIQSPYADFHVIDTGRLSNYITSNTFRVATGENTETFLIGRDDLRYSSMRWGYGGYYYNDYLYFGTFRIGYNGSEIRFHTGTCNDFTVAADEEKTLVSYSMTDDSAGIQKVGVKCINRVYGFKDRGILDFLIYEYLIINQSANELADVYAGLQMDYDISAASGGSFYWRDDRVGYYLGTDAEGAEESISYMYDGDDPDILGNDLGGKLIPKESLGYIGSRIISSPPTKHGLPANRMSGHQFIDWTNTIQEALGYYSLMQKETYQAPDDTPSDYFVFQVAGPYDLPAGDTLTIAYAIGIGEGLDGLRRSLHYAYNLYHSPNKRPIIDSVSPQDSLVVFQGETVPFKVTASGRDGELLDYLWTINDMLSRHRDPVFIFNAGDYKPGHYKISVRVTNNRFWTDKSWQVEVRPARKFHLAQNYPNPFNGITTIPFEIKTEGLVTITVYDISGKKVVTLIREKLPPGQWEARWDGTTIDGITVSSGFYLYRIEAAGFISHKKMLYLR